MPTNASLPPTLSSLRVLKLPIMPRTVTFCPPHAAVRVNSWGRTGNWAVGHARGPQGMNSVPKLTPVRSYGMAELLKYRWFMGEGVVDSE